MRTAMLKNCRPLKQPVSDADLRSLNMQVKKYLVDTGLMDALREMFNEHADALSAGRPSAFGNLLTPQERSAPLIAQYVGPAPAGTKARPGT
jgi:hypothetical protein